MTWINSTNGVKTWQKRIAFSAYPLQTAELSRSMFKKKKKKTYRGNLHTVLNSQHGNEWICSKQSEHDSTIRLVITVESSFLDRSSCIFFTGEKSMRSKENHSAVQQRKIDCDVRGPWIAGTVLIIALRWHNCMVQLDARLIPATAMDHPGQLV